MPDQYYSIREVERYTSKPNTPRIRYTSVLEVIRLLYCSQDFREVSICSFSIAALGWQVNAMVETR
ncbi:hypothetical protein BDZ89DRAFT_1076160 [Hymenopellis radicata]|nr:hypothetical protein BDZ89DRAFT_1076160 [Hymenopellis radicata]